MAAGSTLRFESNIGKVEATVAQIERRLAQPGQLLDAIGEYLLESTQRRFGSQTAPDGTPWAALQPRYAKRKKYGKGKILTLRGYLRSQMRWQRDGADAVLVGSNREYAGIHQHGGEIDMPARQATQYLRKNARTGKVGLLFVKKKKANHTRQITIGAHKVIMPARPFLGVSNADGSEISQITLAWLNGKR